MQTSNIVSLIFDLCPLKTTGFLFFCHVFVLLFGCCWQHSKKKNIVVLLLRKLYRFFIMRDCCKDSWPELWMIDTLMTLQLMRQKFSQQNSIKINISKILRWTKLHSVQPKHSLLAREVANSSSSLPELFFLFIFSFWQSAAQVS